MGTENFEIVCLKHLEKYELLKKLNTDGGLYYHQNKLIF